MPRILTPIKVKIEKHTQKVGDHEPGHHKYPEFGALPAVTNSGVSWQRYVDLYGLGWHYDKKCGHAEDEVGSPAGMQWGVLIVPKEFVDQATAIYPDLVLKMTEVELESFYNDRAHAHEPDQEIDVGILNGIKAKQDVGAPLTDQQNKALDPNDDTRGIRKNKQRFWADFKTVKGVEIA